MAVEKAKANIGEKKKTSYSYGGKFPPREPLFSPTDMPASSPVPDPYYKKKKYKSVVIDDDYHPAPRTRSITSQEIRMVILIMIVVTAIFMGIIVIAAERAVLQKDINDLNNDVTKIDEDISTIKVEIEQAKNIHYVVGQAREELGMSEPSYDQQIFINELAPIEGSFVEYIKGKTGVTAAVSSDENSASESTDERDVTNSEENYDEEYDEEEYSENTYYEEEDYDEEYYEEDESEVDYDETAEDE